MFEELLTDLSKRQNKKVQILDQNFFIWVFSGKNFKKILSCMNSIR